MVKTHIVRQRWNIKGRNIKSCGFTLKKKNIVDERGNRVKFVTISVKIPLILCLPIPW